jgi:hypothetical protein
MKYVVELKYTNPAHDHVTLRRRVDTVNRIVEAKNEAEALNRAANQQRALGFKIQEAKIIKEEKPAAPKLVIAESMHKKYDVKDASDKMDDEEEDDEEDDDKKDMKEGIAADMFAARRQRAQKLVADKITTKELAANKEKAGYKYGKELRAAKVAAKKLGEETEVQYIEEKLTAADPASKWISDFVASENPKFAGKSKKERINMALGAYYSAKRGGDMKEGFDPSSKDIAKMLVKKHGAGNVTKQHILDLEMDRDSMKGLDHDEIMKHVAKMDEAVSFGRSGGVMHYNPKTEKSEKEGTAKLYDPKKHDKKLSPKGGFAKMKKEEVEQIDELKKSTLASYVNKAANQVRAKTGIAASFETSGSRKRDPENKAAYMGLAKDFRQGAKKRLTGIEKATSKLAKEEVEEIDEANTRVVNKEVKKEKAAETAVAAARRAKNTKNKVEVEPKLDMNVAGSEKKYVTKV